MKVCQHFRFLSETEVNQLYNNFSDVLVGHMSRGCPKPTDWSRVQCKNCGESKFPFQLSLYLKARY